ncbi:hypothetical protein BVRB_4g082080 [Beta vulgaris subsp. vulgaris]|nr:hypothetical protein BVRB_4g082080 [Beta vulgaris subsp. vulgaris]
MAKFLKLKNPNLRIMLIVILVDTSRGKKPSILNPAYTNKL